MNFDNKNKLKGPLRVYRAFTNSCKGLHWLSRNETAFKQEMLLLLVLSTIAFLLNITIVERALLLVSLLVILLAEIVNTAIEVIVDRISLELHELSGLAKDLGSSCVFVAMVIAIVIWGGVLWS